MELKKKYVPWLYAVSILVIFLYPLRHVCQGVDVWDGGYNYANASFWGLEYMDSMWFFATWIANAVGSLLASLPGGDTMVGMNVYTGLVIGVMGAGAYIFCTRKLQMPAWLAFVGEILALSLCWVPSSALYNYLTYGLLLAGVICLYYGVVDGKNWCLVLAGVALGLNVGVRFSNLVQAGLIVVVWYGSLLGKDTWNKTLWEKYKWKMLIHKTMFCMLGYFGAYGLFLLAISCGYGFSSYIEGIRQLFAMTDTATDYSAFSMLEGMIGAYIAPNTTYWLKRIGLAGVGAVLVCLLLPKKWKRAKQVLTVAIVAALGWYLLRNGYCTQNFKNYDSIYTHCVILFLMVIVLSIYNMCCGRKVSPQEKVQALLVVLILCLTSLGGNNAMYASINNLFLAAPLFLWMIYRFVKREQGVGYFPFQAFAAAGAILLLVQGGRFGWHFVYEGATGGQSFAYEITSVPVLKGMHTNEEHGRQLEELYAYLQENNLTEAECILYGNIPGIAYYMQLAPAMNCWSDLRSYVQERMQEDLQCVETQMQNGGGKPLVILERNYMEYLESGETEGILIDDISVLEKFHVLADFLEQYGYEKDYISEKYVVYR